MIDTQGKLLVAPPSMPDPRFAKTVVYIWRHDVSGAAGVIINKRCQKPTFKHVCEESGLSRKETANPPVHYGGPILNNIVGVLHSTDFVLPSTNTLTAMGTDGPIGFTLDRQMLEIIAKEIGRRPRHHCAMVVKLQRMHCGLSSITRKHIHISRTLVKQLLQAERFQPICIITQEQDIVIQETTQVLRVKHILP